MENSVRILLLLLLTACTALPAPTHTPSAVPPVSTPVTVSPTVLPSPTAPVESTPDKWSLWTRGTQLRGANIWQRVRDPDLNSMNPLYGPDPANASIMDNDLAAVLRSFWGRNLIRP